MASVSRKIPADLSPQKREEVRQMAVKSFKSLGCNEVSRIDFMIDEYSGKLYFKEIGTRCQVQIKFLYSVCWTCYEKQAYSVFQDA